MRCTTLVFVLVGLLPVFARHVPQKQQLHAKHHELEIEEEEEIAAEAETFHTLISAHKEFAKANLARLNGISDRYDSVKQDLDLVLEEHDTVTQMMTQANNSVKEKCALFKAKIDAYLKKQQRRASHAVTRAWDSFTGKTDYANVAKPMIQKALATLDECLTIPPLVYKKLGPDAES
eukprot:c1769_g1_i1.p1 GENE.c1769_g1_i1~~c1769_g1_i1.p1  ORF type:complete len:177 (-),score=29.43 c1769_g1_i1:25-555(-)